MSARIHPTALIEEGVRIGRGTAVWDAVHIRRAAEIGEDIGDVEVVRRQGGLGDFQAALEQGLGSRIIPLADVHPGQVGEDFGHARVLGS